MWTVERERADVIRSTYMRRQEEWNVQNLKRLIGHNRLIDLAYSVKVCRHHLTQWMTTRVVPRAPDIFIVPILFYIFFLLKNSIFFWIFTLFLFFVAIRNAVSRESVFEYSIHLYRFTYNMLVHISNFLYHSHIFNSIKKKEKRKWRLYKIIFLF